MKRSIKILLFCVACLSLVSWDRASKELAKTHLKDQPVQSYFHDTFRLLYVENTGAALSLGDDLSKGWSFWLLSAVPLALLLGMSGYVIRHCDKMDKAKMTAFTLIIAGGLGNIFDRIVYDRHVTDFMNIGISNLRTGIFNFADVFITAGAIMLVLAFKKTVPNTA
ncbi:MAG: signal peptidase [Bacteroidota bacterium]|jgi:signal peptidase II